MMCRLLAGMLAGAALASAACAQTPAASGGATAQAPVVQSSTRLAVVDVVVHDRNGQPVRGLKAQNFRLTESGVAQAIGRVEEHTSQAAATAAPASYPPQPAGIFTDFTPVASGSALNVLLIDALNTPGNDQAFIRYQLQQYVKRANPTMRIAVFGLANRLILLQGFTSDPGVLRGVVERKLIARSSSSLLPSTSEGVADQQRGPGDLVSSAAPTSNGSPSAIDIAANLREFQTELGAMETQLRAHYTLDALNTLAHYLAGFPGRKNVIWFSGSFPLSIVPDPGSSRPTEGADLDPAEFRETVDLLAKAQVAMYPVDARGLMMQPTSGMAAGSLAHASEPRRVVAELNKFSQNEAAEHTVMDELATGTGGLAFYNPSDLAAAVSSAVGAGSDYYTLSYSPSNTNEDGAYRPIRVEASGVEGAQTLELFYRRGYDAGEAGSASKPAGKAETSAASSEEGRVAAYKQAAMSRGAPAPEDILFKARVLPTSGETETAVAPDNELSLSVPASGPFRRYAIDTIALTGELTFTPQPDGRRTAQVEFLAYVYDTEGRRLNATGKVMSLEATTANVTKLAHGVLRCHLEVSVPDRAETFLRIGIRDVATNRFGVIEIPASSLSSLPAVADPPVAPSGRATPPKD